MVQSLHQCRDWVEKAICGYCHKLSLPRHPYCGRLCPVSLHSTDAASAEQSAEWLLTDAL